MRRALMALGTTALLAALPIPAVADHANDAAAHWRLEGEGFVPVLNSLPSKWDPMVAAVVGAWSAADGIDLRIERAFDCAETPGAIVLCPVDQVTFTFPDGSHPRALMSPRFEHPGVFIVSAVGEFARPRTRPVCGSTRCKKSRRYFQYILCHELGHAVGLVHPAVFVATVNFAANGSCMGGGLWPDAHDLAEVSALHQT